MGGEFRLRFNIFGVFFQFRQGGCVVAGLFEGQSQILQKSHVGLQAVQRHGLLEKARAFGVTLGIVVSQPNAIDCQSLGADFPLAQVGGIRRRRRAVQELHPPHCFVQDAVRVRVLGFHPSLHEVSPTTALQSFEAKVKFPLPGGVSSDSRFNAVHCLLLNLMGVL